MRTFIIITLGGIITAVLALATVFFIGMRANTPAVVDTVRRLGRATGPRVLRSAGTPGNSTAVIQHIGRTSGRQYRTPIVAHQVTDGFLIALPYGKRTDWLRNVLAKGTATIVTSGTTHHLAHPTVLPRTEVTDQLPAREARTLRLFAVQEVLHLRYANPTKAQ